MANVVAFEDYDLLDVYKRAQEAAEAPRARNFVVEFGPFASRIASDVDASGFKQLMSDESATNSVQRPTRWMYVHCIEMRPLSTATNRVHSNIWAPNEQKDSVEAIGRRYGFSPRLLALLCTVPPLAETPVQNDSLEEKSASTSIEDLERGIDMPQDSSREVRKAGDKNFFDIARNFTSYQSIDIGERDKCTYAPCECIVPLTF